MDLFVIPECYIDTNLVETLVPPKQQGYNHQKGCGTVAKVMQERFADNFAVGIIDKDKQELDYLNAFYTVSDKGSIELLKHKSRNHFFIRIKPAMERFILYNASQAGINMSDFGLPTDFEPFRKMTKTIVSKKDDRFKSLFKALKKSGNADIALLTRWIEYLVSHPYDVDVLTLQTM